MSERLYGYTPIPEANTKRVRAAISLPFGIEEKIGLDTNYIHTLLQIGGLKSIKILSDNGEETSTAIPIVGFGRDGSALAGKGKMSMVPTYKADLDQNNFSDTTKQFCWPNLKLVINNNEIKQRMLASDQVVTNSKNWAREIDMAIKKAVRSAGTKNLTDISKSRIMDYLWSVSFIASFISQDLYILGITTHEFMKIMSSSYFFSKLENFKDGSGYRLSAFPCCELDRALILNIASRVKPVAKEISGDKN